MGERDRPRPLRMVISACFRSNRMKRAIPGFIIGRIWGTVGDVDDERARPSIGRGGASGLESGSKAFCQLRRAAAWRIYHADTAHWLKVLNAIHGDLFNGMDLFGGSKFAFDESFLLSGPWVMSVAPTAYLQLNGKNVYSDLKFIYSTADSATGNQLSPEADMLNVPIFA